MLNDWLTSERIQIRTDITDWRQAVEVSAEPLLKEGTITPDYLTAFLRSGKSWGRILFWHRASPCHMPDRKRELMDWGYRC